MLNIIQKTTSLDFLKNSAPTFSGERMNLPLGLKEIPIEFRYRQG